ncbi:MAG: D-alanine--D-alanine ligase [Acidobacteria bacterium]|nr:D-alanine--D-alanine ligase [Acidobacteriota bacterium]
MKKLRVGVIYGGRSGEHEVSIASAAAIFKHLDRARYEAVPIRIEKDGRWVLADKAPVALSASDVIGQQRLQAARVVRPGRDTLLVSHPSDDTLITIERRPASGAGEDEPDRAVVTGLGLDVVFPVLHGPFGEDGTVQGLLELGAVPYVGSGVLASAAGMDKAAMKALFAARGLPQTPYEVVTHFEWTRDPGAASARLLALGLPVFVKPANLGSSLGISKVKSAEALASALATAFAFDRKAVVEAAVPEPREIECAVLGNDEPEASVPGEIIPSREFYDYEAKYLDAGSQTIIPAALDAATVARIQHLSLEAFRAIDGAGMSRVDFLLSRTTGTLALNEINTIPGFTTISMFAKLWEASGVAYGTLIDRLIALAIERHAAKQRLRTSAF